MDRFPDSGGPWWPLPAMFALIMLAWALSGCATAPIPGQQPVPEEFLAPCVAEKRPILVNGDFPRALNDRDRAIEACNLDKEAIRRWSKEVSR